jgi:tRNA-dihydrouridine synthase B
MRAIVRAVKDATSIPVMGKIRSGWKENQIVATQASKILEEEGACAVTVHARTQQMKFTGRADWNVIRDVKQSVMIPVIGNGDVNSPEDAKRMQEETGCDLIMVGRGSMGRPWIFNRINRFLETGELVPEPDYSERIGTCLHHYDIALKHGETERMVKEMRKHVGWYLKGMPGNSQVKREVFLMTNAEEVQAKLREYSVSLQSKE